MKFLQEITNRSATFLNVNFGIRDFLNSQNFQYIGETRKLNPRILELTKTRSRNKFPSCLVPTTSGSRRALNQTANRSNLYLALDPIFKSFEVLSHRSDHRRDIN